MFYYKMQNGETISLEILESVYEPREDSLLLAAELEKILEIKDTKSVLEIGCGSGLLSIIAAKRGCAVLAADVNPAAVECAKRNAELNNVKIKAAQSNLFEKIKGKFGLIIFNPPYLPEEQTEDSRTWAGGKNMEVVTEFIKNAKRHLNDDGRILIVISSLSNPENILKELSDGGFVAKIIAEQKIPWEKLFVVCAKNS
ncbi:MAG: HemK2/MTQ2 family protein methyltransferase [Candidatus Aenigmatarchaeota archaeon]